MPKKDRTNVVEIEIFDQRYPLRLRTPTERTEVLKLAERVDARMRELARESGTVDSLKVAILTALHLAQEQQDMEESVGGLEEAVEAGSKKWIRAIDRVL